MVGARKGPHRSLGFAFGYWFQTTALPTPAILLFAEIEHRPLGRRSQSERLVFSQPHSMRQTCSNSAISRSRIARCLRNSRAMPALRSGLPGAETQALLEAVRQRAEKAQRAAATRARNKAAKQD
jgi:hypothetical protein